MVSTNQVTNDNSQVLITISIPVNKPSAIKPLHQFRNVWMLKRELLSAGWVLLNKSVNILEHVICCDRVFQRGLGIQKSMSF